MVEVTNKKRKRKSQQKSRLTQLTRVDRAVSLP